MYFNDCAGDTCVGGRAGDLRSVEDLDRMIAHSLRDVPDDADDDLSDTDDPELLVSHSVVCSIVTSAHLPRLFFILSVCNMTRS